MKCNEKIIICISVVHYFSAYVILNTFFLRCRKLPDNNCSYACDILHFSLIFKKVVLDFFSLRLLEKAVHIEYY